MSEITIVGGGTSAANRPKSMYTGSANRDDLAKLVAQEIHWLDPWKYPLDSIASMFRSKVRTEQGFEFSYWEDKSLPHTVCINYSAGYSSSATSITVDSADSTRPYDILLAHGATGDEQMLITAVNTSTEALTVSRGFGGTAQALSDNQVLINLGNVAADMSVAPYSRVTVPTEITQYLAGNRTSWSLSSFYEAWKKYHGQNVWQYTKDKNIFEHRKKEELRLFFSMLKKDTSVIGGAASLTNAVAYTYRGIAEWVDTYGESNKVYNAGGNITEDNFMQNFIEPWTSMRPEKPICFCCKELMFGLNYWWKDKIRITPSTKMVGLDIARVQAPIINDIMFIYHPLLDAQSEPSGGNVESVAKGWAFGVDLANIQKIKGTISFNHAGQDITFTDTWIGSVPQAGNPWYLQEEIATLSSIEMKGSDNHIVMKNIGGYA